MTPYTFRANDSRRAYSFASKGRPALYRTLNFRDRFIIPSKTLSEMLNLVHGAHVGITLDEDNPDKIYIRRADDDDDNSNTQTSCVCWDKACRGTFRFSSKAVVEHVLSITEANTSVTLFVSPKPTVIEGKTYYRIIVESPLSIK